jgi:hypothetical protein
LYLEGGVSNGSSFGKILLLNQALLFCGGLILAIVSLIQLGGADLGTLLIQFVRVINRLSLSLIVSGRIRLIKTSSEPS